MKFLGWDRDGDKIWDIDGVVVFATDEDQARAYAEEAGQCRSPEEYIERWGAIYDKNPKEDDLDG